MRPAFTPAPDVRVVIPDEESSSTLYVATMPDGPILVLANEAGAIWLEATTGPAGDWLSRVASRAGLSADEIEPSARTFLADLVERGVLVAEVLP